MIRLLATRRVSRWCLASLLSWTACSDAGPGLQPGPSPQNEPDAYVVSFVCAACGDMRATNMNESGVVAGSELVGGAWVGRLWTRDDAHDLGDYLLATPAVSRRRNSRTDAGEILARLPTADT